MGYISLLILAKELLEEKGFKRAPCIILWFCGSEVHTDEWVLDLKSETQCQYGRAGEKAHSKLFLVVDSE